MSGIRIRHLGFSGLALTWPDGARISVDPPEAQAGPIVVTWTERERVMGARASTGPLAAAPKVAAWIGRGAVPLHDGPAPLRPFVVRARPYRPIPYATPPEALRKTVSAVVGPLRAGRRLAFAVSRPRSPPLTITLDHADVRVVILGQALHRFASDEEVDAMVAWAGPAALVVAGTDYGDEVATGALLGRFEADVRVIADLTGTIRRALGLPVRPLGIALAAAPPGTRRLGPMEDHPRRFAPTPPPPDTMAGC